MRRFWQAIGSALGLAGAAGVAATCSVYDTSLLTGATGAPDVVETSTVPPTEAGDDDGGCALARAPGKKPGGADGPDLPRIVMAVDSLRLDSDPTTADGGLAAPVGLDIDGLCTCPGPESCKPPAGTSAASSKARCDGPGGRDNAAGNLFTNFAKLSPTFQPSRLRDGIVRGSTTMLAVLTRYNGSPNDPGVTFALYVSTGFEGVRLDGGSDAGPTVPRFDGSDRWTIAPASLIGGAALVGTDCDTSNNCLPLYADQDAYVVDGALVAHLDMPVSVTAAFTLEITQATLTARVVAGGGSFRLEAGETSGRVPTKRLLSALGTLEDPFTKQYLCDKNATYQNIKTLVCESADVASDPREDSKGARCDALAASVSFTATPAKLGVVAIPPPSDTTCPGWTDECK